MALVGEEMQKIALVPGTKTLPLPVQSLYQVTTKTTAQVESEHVKLNKMFPISLSLSEQRKENNCSTAMHIIKVLCLAG